jgi:polycomb group RING finger protein 4
MDICVDVAAGLRLLGSPNVITEDCFTKLLEAGICTIADGQKPTNISQLCNSKGDAIKECFAAVLSLLVEAARHDTDPDTLSVTLLQNYNFSSQRSEKLVGIYRQHKTKLQAALSHIGTHPPHITDASWTLDYCVKASSLEQVGSYVYLIQFHTESCEEGGISSLKFLCTQEELQDLVWKMRDAVRHVERIANI